MKIFSIIIILLINVLLWNFISMAPPRIKGEGSSLSKNRGGPQQIHKKIHKDYLDQLREKNNCNEQITKKINPNEKTQQELINYYLENNEIFVEAHKQAKGGNTEIKMLDRLQNQTFRVNTVVT